MLSGLNSTLGGKREAFVVHPVVIDLGLPKALKRLLSMIKNRHFFALCWRQY